MSGRLKGKRILIAEDDYLIGDDLAQKLQAFGANVVGPANTVRLAHQLIDTDERIDGAVLDIHLRGEFIYAIVDHLHERGVPVVFITGYGPDAISRRYRDVPVCEKPFDAASLRLMASRFAG